MQRGISTSQELARYLLDEWDIATLPGTVFGEQPEVLLLRLARQPLPKREWATVTAINPAEESTVVAQER